MNDEIRAALAAALRLLPASVPGLAELLDAVDLASWTGEPEVVQDVVAEARDARGLTPGYH